MIYYFSLTHCRWPKLEEIRTCRITREFIENHPNMKKIVIFSCENPGEGFPNLEHLDVVYNYAEFIRPLSDGNYSSQTSYCVSHLLSARNFTAKYDLNDDDQFFYFYMYSHSIMTSNFLNHEKCIGS